MRFQITALFLCLAANVMCQKKIYFDCSLAHQIKEKDQNYAKVYQIEDTLTYVYYNHANVHLKTETYLTSMAPMVKWGPELIMNLNGTIYSSGYYINGKKNGLFILNDRSGNSFHKQYKFNQITSSVTLNYANDTIEHIIYNDSGKSTILKSDISKHNPVLIFYNIFGRDSIVESDSIDISYIADKTVLIMPKLKVDYYDFLLKNLVYPKSLEDLNVCADIKIKFIIHPNGRISNVRVEGPVSYAAFEEEAIRCMIKTDGLWLPATFYGKPIKMDSIIVIGFQMSDYNSED